MAAPMLAHQHGVPSEGRAATTFDRDVQVEEPTKIVPVSGLLVGSASDPAEVEADLLAERAMSALHRSESGTASAAGSVTAGPHRALRRSATPDTQAVVGAEGGAVPADIGERIQRSRAGGQPLAPELRRRMETAFDTDLGGVRVHHGDEPGSLNRALSARAFTAGSDIYFGEGVYRPGTPEGVHIIAHEIAHTQQHGAGATPSVGRLRRILQTRQQLEAAVGKAKSDVKLGGLTFKAMGTKYKAILAELDAYHNRINRTQIQPNTAPGEVRLLDEMLERVQTACGKYLQDHTEGDDRASWISDLRDKAGVERQIVATLGGQAGALAGKTWVEALPKVGGATGGLDVPTGVTPERQQDPGLEGKVVKGGTIQPSLDPTRGPSGTATPLAKGASVIIHETESSRYVYVETYTPNEKLGTFAVQASGYTLSSNVKAGSTKHKKLDNDVPIFTREPNVNDVNQGAIGDCYLVAALASIAAINPRAIYDMMRDNGDGTVTVRLYSIVPPPGQTARYFTIAKSVVSDERKSSGALWVPLLEKAFATLGQGADKSTIGSKSYAQIGDGGHSDRAFHILTGQAPQAQGQVKSTNFDMINAWGAGQILTMEKKGVDKTEAYTKIYGKDARLATAFFVFAKKHGEAMNKFRTYEEFDELVKREHLAAEVAGPLLTDMRRQVPGRRGSGMYTPSQTDLYDRIRDRIANGGYVAAGTAKEIKLEKGGGKGKGHSGGEEMGEGLVGQHAYSITAAREITSTSGVTRKYIRVRNPWGDDSSVEGRGRVYKELDDGTLDIETDPATLKAKARAEFDMELTDFTKHFEKIYWS